MVGFFLILSGILQPAVAGVTGKINGVVKDKSTGDFIPAVTVTVEETVLGAISSTDGFYQILNVPVGTYKLKASIIGYKDLIVKNVRVQPDLTTTINFKLESTVIEVSEGVIIEAERPLIQKDVTSSRSFVTSEDLVQKPVDNVQQAVNQSAGVVQGSFRGGRLNTGEVIYLVDGVSLQSPIGNRAGAGNAALATTLPQLGIEEVEVLTGGFNAEYGNAQSAIVNVIMKEGGQSHTGRLRTFYSPEVLTKGNTLGLSETKLKYKSAGQESVFDLHKYNFQNTQFSIGGPNPLAPYILPLKSLGNGNYFISGEYLDTRGRFKTQHTIRWSGEGKFSFRPSPNKKISIGFLKTKSDFDVAPYWVSGDDGVTGEDWSLIVSTGDTIWTGDDGRATWVRPKDPEAHFVVVDSLEGPNGEKMAVKNWDMSTNYSGVNREYSNELNLAYTHTVSSETFYELRFSRFETGSYNAELDPWELAHGKKVELDKSQILQNRFFKNTIPILDDYYHVSPNDLYDIRQEDNQIIYTAKADITSQFTKTHQGKRGVELRLYDLNMDYTSPRSGDNVYRDVYHVKPIQAAGYVQEKFETLGMILNTGLRLDYFDPRVSLPADPNNPVNFAYQKTIQDNGEYSNDPRWIVNPVEAKARLYLSPRFGISYPITEGDVMHITYGHFLQFPVFQRYFENYKYNWDGAWKYVGNPDLKPERTILYEMGVAHQFFDQMAVDVTGFYKDIYNLIDFSEKARVGSARYMHYLYENTAYGNIRGFEISATQRRWHNLSGNLAYTFQIARGKNSNIRQGFLDLYDRRVPRTQDYYLDWDQRHTINLTLDYRLPTDMGWVLGGWGANIHFEYGSGKPYSSSLRGQNPPINDRRYPSTSNVDALFSKQVSLGKYKASILLEILNLLNKRNLIQIQDAEYLEAYKKSQEEGGLGFERAATGRFNSPTSWGELRRSRLGFEINF